MTKTADGNNSEESKIVIRDRRRIDPETGVARQVDAANVGGTEAKKSSPSGKTVGAPPSSKTPGKTAAAAAVDGKAKASASALAGEEVATLTAKLAERTSDLQRVTAEYANYRKRVDRDRQVASEKATAALLTALLPVLDDLDRARAHGDLTGAFGAVAEQLITVLTKHGLAPFGEAGEPFDPSYHEAVMHMVSEDVSEPTCVEVLRKGYLMGDKLLRAAMVSVADPSEQMAAAGTGAAGASAESVRDADEAAGAAAVD
ncbi:MAG TPA: nucleotide exchange factor GrpE [Cryptosporangiaceae bacterium]|nr:nucleotide exchange factor GrpE [Cryptosporangiaceae bacterium]